MGKPSIFAIPLCFLLFVAACGSQDASKKGNVVFVSKSKGSADMKTWDLAGGLRGLEAADGVCQSEAIEAGLKGIYKAWLSDSDTDAKDRVGPNGSGWLRADGHPFAMTLEYLLDAPTVSAKEKDGISGPLVPVRYHADGTLASPSAVFTNTGTDGRKYISHDGVTEDCGGWDSSQESGYQGIGGYSESSGVNWTNNGNAIAVKCSDELPIYCFGIDEGLYDPLTRDDLVAEGKLAFLTSLKGPGDFGEGNWVPYSAGQGGLGGADLVCRGLASAAGLSNPDKYKAFLSSTVPSIINAVDRYIYDGPWVMTNGVLVAGGKSEFADGTVFADLDVDEKGQKIHDNFYLDYNFVWTGSDSLGYAVLSGESTGGDFLDNLNCQGWDSLDGIARIGKFSVADLQWISYTIDGNDFYSCDNYYRIYCLEDE